MRSTIVASSLLAALSASANVLPSKHYDSTLKRSTDCSDPEVRPEWRTMSHKEQVSFVNSIACLMEAPPKGPWNVTSRYDELVKIHLDHVDFMHNFGLFLPYHRYFLHGFYGMLKDECGYDGPFPWWNELEDSGDFASSGLFEPDLFGTLPERGPGNNQSICVEDGAFVDRMATVGYDKPVCLARGENKEYSAMANPTRLAACHNNVTNFEDHELCVQNGIHISTHAAVGDMIGFVPGSVNDPVFFMHHSFIDWEWKRWQKVDAKRDEEVSGCAEFGDGPCVPINLDTELTSWGVFPQNMTIRDVVNTEKSPMCYVYDDYHL